MRRCRTSLRPSCSEIRQGNGHVGSIQTGQTQKIMKVSPKVTSKPSSTSTHIITRTTCVKAHHRMRWPVKLYRVCPGVLPARSLQTTPARSSSASSVLLRRTRTAALTIEYTFIALEQPTPSWIAAPPSRMAAAPLSRPLRHQHQLLPQRLHQRPRSP